MVINNNGEHHSMHLLVEFELNAHISIFVRMDFICFCFLAGIMHGVKWSNENQRQQ